MNEKVKQYGIAVLVVGSLMLGYKAYDSYQHFTWQNVQLQKDGPFFALPTWRK